jgi:hypothetical protein
MPREPCADLACRDERKAGADGPLPRRHEDSSIAPFQSSDPEERDSTVGVSLDVHSLGLVPEIVRHLPDLLRGGWMAEGVDPIAPVVAGVRREGRRTPSP